VDVTLLNPVHDLHVVRVVRLPVPVSDDSVTFVFEYSGLYLVRRNRNYQKQVFTSMDYETFSLGQFASRRVLSEQEGLLLPLSWMCYIVYTVPTVAPVNIVVCGLSCI
jgi:hypothetical protein